jgi:hypothetical protein
LEDVRPHSNVGCDASSDLCMVFDIHNQKWPISKTSMLVFVERSSATILDGLSDKIGDPGVPTISCLIDT